MLRGDVEKAVVLGGAQHKFVVPLAPKVVVVKLPLFVGGIFEFSTPSTENLSKKYLSEKEVNAKMFIH